MKIEAIKYDADVSGDVNYLLCTAEDDCNDSFERRDIVYSLVKGSSGEEVSLVITPSERIADQSPL